MKEWTRLRAWDLYTWRRWVRIVQTILLVGYAAIGLALGVLLVIWDLDLLSWVVICSSVLIIAFGATMVGAVYYWFPRVDAELAAEHAAEHEADDSVGGSS